MSKTIYLAPSPRKNNFQTVYEIWNALERENIRDLKIFGIQAHSKNEYSIINSPTDFYEPENVWDTHVAPMLALCMINPSWLNNHTDQHGTYKEWKFGGLSSDEYPTVPATEFGLALGGCGRMGTMMQYPWTRFQSIHEPKSVITATRQNYNINGLTMGASVNFEPDAKKAVESTKIMLGTEFSGDFMGLEENKKDIQRVSNCMQSSLMFLGLARLKQIESAR